MTSVADTSVKKSITVNTSVERAFEVFTAGFDSWWPRTHKLTPADLDVAIVEGKVGGRCYQRAVDGSECDWGKVTAWEPPHRVVVAWQLDGKWQYDPDLTHASEVEVTFTAEDGGTRVVLEHRHFERHGADGIQVQTGVGGEGGWNSLLGLFKARAES